MESNKNTIIYNNKPRFYYKAIDVYEEVKDPENWLNCPNCGLKPLIWEFDNGRYTACGCGENEYFHFKVSAESIVNSMKNSYNGQSMEFYDIDELKNNWNHWVKTGKLKYVYNKNERSGVV